MKLAIIISDTYPEITGKMLQKAQKLLQEHEVIVKHVPGSFDIPMAASKLIEQVEGVITLGAIIQGETAHDEVIGYSIANSLSLLSIQHKKPVTLGVSGPRQTRQQAEARIDKMAIGATSGCLELLK